MVTVTAGTTRTTRLDMDGADELIVEATAAFSVSANQQTVRFNGATTNATIINNGILEQTSGGRAIRVETSAGTSFTAVLTNSADGIIRSGDDAIQFQDGGANSVASGSFIVGNSGDVLSTGGQGFDIASTIGTFLASIQNNATGSIISNTSEAIRFGLRGDLLNRGTINGGNNAAYGDGSAGDNTDGVSFADNSVGNVQNYGAGSIAGDRHGIDAGTGSNITVTNGAVGDTNSSITGRNGSGVGSDGNATVTNFGIITGNFANIAGSDVNGTTVGAEDGGGPDGILDGDGDGIDADGLLILENYGFIEGTGAGGSGSDGFTNTAEGVAAGGGGIVNYVGGVIRGAGLGILIDDSSRGNAPFLTVITNDGTITGQAGIGIRIVSNKNDTITNSGHIEGVGKAIEFGSGNNTLTIENGSTIVGISDGGLGSDLLDYLSFGTAVTVNLTTGAATGTGGVTNFENAYGSTFGDTFTGNAERNLLDGRTGADTLTGLAGNDTYYVDNGGDKVIEAANEGTDIVYATASYALAANQSVETLQLAASTVAQPLNITGNNLGNVLIGNAGANVLNGGGGADSMQGGSGNDSYVVDNAGDVVKENGGANSGVDTVVTTVSYALTAGQYVEVLQLSGSTGSLALNLTGNELANSLLGGAGSNALQGLAGADVLQGAGGRDILVPGNDSDVDTIRFNAIADSTGGNRDQLIGADFANEDKLDFAVRPTVFAGTVSVGALNNGPNFNIEIGNAVNGLLNAGGPVEAVLFDPNSGGLNQPGFFYLVVDANNDGSYTASADYLVELVNFTGTLDATDFI